MAVRSNRSGRQPFVGRSRELTVAADVLADTDRAGVVLIGGESGLGKTRLVEEIIAAAPSANLVARGGAVPRTTPIPFELVRSVFSAQRSPTATEPDWSNSEETGSGIDRVRTEAEALRNLGEGPTIFVFEDVHWADPESLEVIERLLAAGPLGASLLITYRPNALHPDHPTSSFLQRAERRSHVVQFRLEPLRREEVGQYLGSCGRTVDQATVERVHARTGGNPLLLSELVAATAEDADLTGGLPWTLAEMLRPEIERLPSAERQVAEAVAVLGNDVDFDLLAAAVAGDEDSLIGRLRALVDNGILVERGPDRFGFRHDLVREAVADSLFTREHRRIHAAVHDALVASGSDDIVALVTHATSAGRTKQAADAARDAAFLALADGRSHQAASFAEQALLEHTDDIDLLRVAVISGWMTARYRPAMHHLDRWEELVGGDPTAQAQILHHRVRMLWEQWNSSAADEVAEELAVLANTLETGVARAQALADVAQHHMLMGRAGQAIDFADQALAVAAEVGPVADGAALQARAERGSAMVSTADDEAAAVAELLGVADAAAAAGDHLVASRALHNVPIHQPMVDPRSHIEAMRRAGVAAGLNSLANDSYRQVMMALAEIEADHDSYASMVESALDALEDQTLLRLNAATFELDNGKPEEARRLLAGLEPPGGSHSAPAWELAEEWKRGALALIEMVEGNAEPVRQWLECSNFDHSAGRFATRNLSRYLSDLVALGLGDQILPVLDQLEVGQKYDGLYRAVRADLSGDEALAESRYREALESGRRWSVVVESEIHLARARLAEGRGDDPRPHLEAAASRLATWPGRRLDRVRSLLGDVPTPEPPGGLTPREREVALLVSRGLTNGGIADELFISTKTASVHVSNILAKLDMATRTEIASWVVGGGLES